MRGEDSAHSRVEQKMTAAAALGIRCVVAASRNPNRLTMLRGERAASMTLKSCEQLLGVIELNSRMLVDTVKSSRANYF
jgi:hypothetical protein